MKTDSTFKIGIYQQIAKRLNNERIVHCAAHGVDYRQGLFGRDVDIMIRKHDIKKVRTIVCDVFRSNGILFKINKFSWADWIIGYKEDDGNVNFIEIDLFYHINFRMIELTDPDLLGISDEPILFYTNDWQTYAKVVLLKFFGMNLKKLSEKKFKEVQRVASLVNPKSSKKFPSSFIVELNDKIASADFDGLMNLRKKYSYKEFAKRDFFQSIRILGDCTIAMLHRKMKAFSIVPVMILPIESKNIIDVDREILSMESFITCVNEITVENGDLTGLLMAYRKFKRDSEPLSLNIIYTKNVGTLVSALFRFLSVKIIKEPVSCQALLHVIC